MKFLFQVCTDFLVRISTIEPEKELHWKVPPGTVFVQQLGYVRDLMDRKTRAIYQVVP